MRGDRAGCADSGRSVLIQQQKKFILGLGFSLLAGAACLRPVVSEARPASFDSLRSLVVTGHLSAALVELENIQEKKLDPAQRPLWRFAKGVLYFENEIFVSIIFTLNFFK